MTRLEKAKELHPELTEDEIIEGKCPSDLFDIETVFCDTGADECAVCWNEEYKEGEQA